jgi:hypothetical protein
MYVLIDRERMAITHRHLRKDAIANVAHIEMAHSATIICDEMDYVTFESFTDLELNKLLVNMCGQKYASIDRYGLVQMVRHVCFSLYPSVIDGFEAAKQAMSIPMDDNGFYKYQPGADVPTPLDDLYAVKPLTGTANPNLVLPPAPVFNTPPAQRTQAATAPVKRAPATNNDAPKHGSKTGRVWEIADSIYKPGNDLKSIRGAIIAACEAEGINSSTASVQYSKWKQTKQ